MVIRFLCAFVICAFLIPSNLIGQNVPQEKRPTVGLVLSGGGARGFAHIGVLKVLEENRIPVDYIGGASMGALIGSLYALGKSPTEIESIVLSLDWERLLGPTAPARDLSFRRKEDRRNIPAPVILKGRVTDLKLPNALNSGHEIGLLIDRMTIQYATETDFSQLPIPFGAVGTDMIKGESVMLRRGSLSRSLRATMSIPGVFAPVEIDGRVLSDGGLVNNIPTDIVKAMGADIILVVNIETELGGREVLDSLPGILAQTINIATVDNSRRSLRQADLIVSPNLQKYTSSDFDKARELIDLGYAGAQDRTAILKPLSLDQASWQEHLEARKTRVQSDVSPIADYVAVESKDSDQQKLIMEKLENKYDGKKLDSDTITKLERDLSELTGTGRFDALDYQLIKKDGKTELLIGSTKPGGETRKPSRLELGLDVNSVEADNVNFNFIARLTLFDVGSRGSEWRNDVRLGSNAYIASEYFRPIARSKFFVAPKVSYERRRINSFNESGDRIGEYVAKQSQIGIDLGYSFNDRNEFRGGYTFGYQSALRRIGDPLLPEVNGIFSTLGFRWNYDSLDRSQVPNNGSLIRTSLNYFLDSPESVERFGQGEARVLSFRQVSPRNTLFFIGGAGSTFGNTAPPSQQFTLGGPFRIGGYGFEELRGSNYLQTGFGFLHNPSIIPTFLGGRTYIGAWYESGSTFESFRGFNYRQSVSGGVVFETPVGTVFVGSSINENGRGRFYFSFGRWFR